MATYSKRSSEDDGEDRLLGQRDLYSSDMQLTAAITHEASWYVARCIEVEVASQGETADEALANLKEALELYFEDTPPEGIEAPIIATVDIAA